MFTLIFALARLCALLYGICFVIKHACTAMFGKFSKSMCEGGLKSLGKWAVVTGATDGIGKEMAKEIANEGMDVCLIGRSQEKLDATENDVKQINKGISVKKIVFDFSKKDADYENIQNQLTDIEIGLLVNNVGVSYPGAQFFDELSTEMVESLIDVNVRALLRMTHMVYGNMRTRGCGAIVCVGSGASVVPSEPLYAAYAATKSVSEAFCRSLQAESRGNVLVQCHVPLLVTSKLSKIKTPSLTVPSASTYAKEALRSVKQATADSRAVVSPNFIHHVILCLTNILPAPLWNRIRFTMVKDLRKRYLEKQAKAN